MILRGVIDHVSSIHLSVRPRILELLLAFGLCRCRSCDGRGNTGSLLSVHLRFMPRSRSAGLREGPHPPVSAAAPAPLPLLAEAHGPPASPHPCPHSSFSCRSGREAVSHFGLFCFSLMNETVQCHFPCSLATVALGRTLCASPFACLDTV